MCRVEPGIDCCKRAELAAAYVMGQTGGAPADCIVTENAAFARRAYKLLREIYAAAPDINVKRKQRLKKSASYTVRINSSLIFSDMKNGAAPHSGGVDYLRKLTRKKCCKKAALRGAFLAGGSVTDPEKHYHLEIYSKEYGLTEFLSVIMAGFNLNAKTMKRTDYSIVYIKDSEGIVDFLNITGAYRALMSLENTRILKDMRNSVNRAVNCVTANLEKTANASLRQAINIAYIKETIGFDALPENLREIALIRWANREISLMELGQMLNPPLGKSGVNHRLRKLDSIAEDIRQKADFHKPDIVFKP